MLDALSTAVVELDDQGCVRNMNTAAEICLATGRDRSHGGRFLDIAGIPASLAEAISSSASEQQGRRLRECKLLGGWYDCDIHPLPEQGMLLEFNNLKWQHQQSKLQQLEVQTGMICEAIHAGGKTGCSVFNRRIGSNGNDNRLR